MAGRRPGLTVGTAQKDKIMETAPHAAAEAAITEQGVAGFADTADPRLRALRGALRLRPRSDCTRITSMSRFYAIFATDKPDMLAVRERVRPAHRAYVRNGAAEHSVFVRLGGPTLDMQAATMNGTLLVIEAEHIDDVHRFVSGDPYMHAGIFERVDIRPWDWSLGNPERGV
jgi:uncharacterized protein YciI